MHGAIHRGNGRVVDTLDVAVKVRGLHNLPSRLHVDADNALIAKVEDIAPVLLQMGREKSKKCWMSGGVSLGCTSMP